MADYYKRLIFGEGDSSQEFKLAVNLSGEGAPGEAVAADVGMLYIDSSSKNGDLYKCIAVTVTESGTAYTWKKLVDNSIYVLKEGETIEDAPDDAIIVIDPYDDTAEEDNAVKYVAQELTEEQKKQARENIGAQVTSVNGKTGAVTVKETDPATVPNKASVDGSTLKMQRETAGGVVDLFEVDLSSGGGETKYVKIIDNAEITEAISYIEFTDIEEYDDFIFDGIFLNGSPSGVIICVNGTQVTPNMGAYFIHSHTKRNITHIFIDRKRRFLEIESSSQQLDLKYNLDIIIPHTFSNVLNDGEEITSFGFQLSGSSVTFAVGSTYTLWGRKRDV